MDKGPGSGWTACRPGCECVAPARPAAEDRGSGPVLDPSGREVGYREGPEYDRLRGRPFWVRSWRML